MAPEVVARLGALPWYGGKAQGGHNARVGRYIARTLPIRKGYAEPFAGMLGVLLQRPKSKREVVNDADNLVVNWWRAVRDQPDPFTHLVTNTPMSRTEFFRAKHIIDTAPPTSESPDLHLAWAFFVVVRMSVFHCPGQSGIALKICTESGAEESVPDIRRLADRIRRVHLECLDGCDLLLRLAPRSDYSIYVDPPYRDANTSAYRRSVNRDNLRKALEAQNSAVAISGYADEWDCLRWHRKEFNTAHVDAKGRSTPRTEVVWTNFQPPPSLFQT